MEGFLSENIKITKVKDHQGAGTSDVNSDSVDMQEDGGWDGVLFMSSYGTAAANNNLKAQQSSDDGVGDTFADLAGTKLGNGASDEDQWIDIKRPQERYVRCVGLRGTSSTLESIWALRYRGRDLPATNVVTGTIFGEQHTAPAEGTA